MRQGSDAPLLRKIYALLLIMYQDRGSALFASERPTFSDVDAPLPRNIHWPLRKSYKLRDFLFLPFFAFDAADCTDAPWPGKTYKPLRCA